MLWINVKKKQKYQPKEERAYRIVLKYVHHSVHTEDIAAELEAKGHRIRHITNGWHWKTKDPLNLFFIDLEPAENNNDVFKIHRLLNQSVTIETPRRYTGIVQCTRCQQYGHSKTYCNKPFVCVKCGGKQHHWLQETQGRTGHVRPRQRPSHREL